MKTYYTVTVRYSADPRFKSDDLTATMKYAIAVALHTGFPTAVQRVNEDVKGVVERSTTVLSMSPAAFDFRMTTAETAIALKAMAHELVHNIDEVVPNLEKEGFAA